MGIWKQAFSVGLYAAGISLAMVEGSSVHAGMIISELGTPVRVDVQSYRGLGFRPDPLPGQLDSDVWRVTGLSDGDGIFGGVHDTGDFARGWSDGGVTTGGVYAFGLDPALGHDPGAGSHTALGFQPIGSDLTPGAVTLRLTNATGSRIDRVEVAFNSLSLNNGGRSSVIHFAHSLDDVVYSVHDEAEFQSPLMSDAMPGWMIAPQHWSGSQLGLSDASDLYLRWRFDDFAGTGSRDELALNGIVITAWGEPQLRTVPEPQSWIALAAAIPLIISARRRQTSGPGGACEGEWSLRADQAAERDGRHGLIHVKRLIRWSGRGRRLNR